VIEKGKISLYEMIYTTYTGTTTTYSGTMTTNTTTTEWYVSKGSDNVSDIKTSGLFMLKAKQKRKDTFAEMLKDNKNIYDKYLAEDKFSFKQIRNLVHLYNTGKPLGQQDYVIKKTKDTIFCEIEPATFNTVSRYRANPEDRFAKIDTTITEYFLANNSTTYLLKTLPKDKRREYVKLLTKGRISLYSYSLNNTAGDSEASLYAGKEPGDLAQIKPAFSHPDKNDKKAFADLISDNPNLSEKFKAMPYDFTHILDYVKMYNSEYLTNNKPAK